MKKNVMSEEVKSQLLGILPMSADAVHEFTPKQFKEIPEEFRPVFMVRQYTNKEVIGIKSLIYRGLSDSQDVGKESTSKAKAIKKFTDSNQDDLEYLQLALVDWKNLINLDTGETLVYDGTIEMIEKLPEVIRKEIFKESVRITGFLDSDAIQ